MNSTDNPYYIEVLKDNRFLKALDLFNSGEWYEAHDLFEEIWHETFGPTRNTLQAIIQISVAQLHLANNNRNGAIMLYGEALGRLKRIDRETLSLDINSLCSIVQTRLIFLQKGKDLSSLKLPVLVFKE